jgi:hypothetical protein
MFRKILIRFKPILIRWLDKIEYFEQSIQVTSKIKPLKTSYSLPFCFLILTFFIIIVISFFIKVFSGEFLVYKSLLFIIGLKLIFILVLAFVIFKIYKFFLDKLRTYFSFQIDQYRRDVLLLWTLLLINLTLF